MRSANPLLPFRGGALRKRQHCNHLEQGVQRMGVELFHDPVIVTAITDRLLHHSVVVNIKGHSYRLRGKVGESDASGQKKKGESK